MNNSFEGGGGGGSVGGVNSPTGIGEAVREPVAELTGFGGGAGGTVRS